MKEIKQLTEANISLNESAESSLKSFDMSSDSLYLENEKHIDKFVKTTRQLFYEVGLFDRFENKGQILKGTLALIENEEKI